MKFLAQELVGIRKSATESGYSVLKEATTMGRLRIMGRDGDQQIEWYQDDPDSLLRASLEVENWLTLPGHLAFGFKQPQLDAGEKITAFDPDAAEIILVPQMRGG
jgi:hypothetical protein